MLQIYNPETLELLYVFPKVITATWTKNFYTPGSFVITLPHCDGLEYIQKNNLVFFDGSCGIIRYRRKNKSGIEIRGHDLKGLCYQRLIIPPFVYENPPTVEGGYDRISGTEEQVIRHYAEMHLINPTDKDRKIDNLYLGDYHGFGNELVWQAKFTNLADELGSICLYSQLGYEIHPDFERKRLVFDVLQGTDRTQSNQNHGLVIFREKFGNVSDMEYVEDSTSDINVAYVLGTGEEEQQFVYEAYSDLSKGFSRKEGNVDASGTDADYYDEAASKGLSHISDNKIKESVSAEANIRLVYKKDWFLGDFVTVVVEDCFGEDMYLNKQITEVTKTYAKSSITVKPVFGEKKQSIIKKIYKER